MNPEEYLKERVEGQIAWFSRKSRQNNRNYIRLEVLAILLSVSIPFVAIFITESNPWARILMGGMGVLIALATGILALMKYRDNWIEYRATAEMLKRERYLYLTRAGAYSGEDNFDEFVMRIEEILAQEVSNWRNYRFAERAGERPPVNNPPDNSP